MAPKAPKAPAVVPKVGPTKRQRNTSCKKAPAWSVESNKRSLRRRHVVRDLNVLAAEASLSTIPVKSEPKRVERLIKAVQRRCSNDDMLRRLHVAVTAWVENGGALQGVVVPPPQQRDDDDRDDAMIGDDGPDAFLSRHKILLADFRLKSKAFMLTYNSADFTKDTWLAFKAFITYLGGTLNVTAWAACLETLRTPPRRIHARTRRVGL